MVNRAKAIAIRKEGTSWALRNNGRWAAVDLINEFGDVEWMPGRLDNIIDVATVEVLG